MSSTDLAHTPAITPPPGVIPNFDDPRSRGGIIISVSAVCLGIMFPVVLTRLYQRLFVTRSPGIEDGACVLAVIAAVSYTAVILSMLNVFGPSLWNVSLGAVMDADFLRKLIIVGRMGYCPAIFFAKLSILLLYLRIFSPNRPTKFLIYFGIVINFLWYTTIFIFVAYSCIPRRSQTWVEGTATPLCKDVGKMIYIQSIFNVISDFYILIIPIPVVWSLQLPPAKKIGVLFTFMTGLLACICGALGLYYRQLSRNPEKTWTVVPTWAVAIVELNVGIVCGCMPYLAPIIRQLHQRLHQSASLEHLRSLVHSAFTRNHTSNVNPFAKTPVERLEIQHSEDKYMSTAILGPVRSAEQSLDNGDNPQFDWLRLPCVPPDRTLSSRREAYE